MPISIGHWFKSGSKETLFFCFFSVRWFRGNSRERGSVDIESGALGPDITSFMRKGSLGLQGRARGSDGIGKTIQRAKKRVERRLGRLGIGKGKKKVGGAEEVSGSCE
jgi:protein unc-80